MSFLQSLLGSWTGTSRRRTDLVDVLLMAGLADGELSQRDLDKIARAIETRAELSGLDWSEVLERARDIAWEGPDFVLSRRRVAESIDDPEARRFALSLAVQFLGSPLAESERDLLSALAADFAVHGAERTELLEPWVETDPLSTGYLRAEFNNPDRVRKESIFDAMSHGESDTELGLLTFKLTAVRSAMTALGDDTQLVTLGEIVSIEEGRFRADAFLRSDGRNWIGRFLTTGEALHPKEQDILRVLLERMDPSVSIFVGFASRLSPADAACTAALDPDRSRIEKLL